MIIKLQRGLCLPFLHGRPSNNRRMNKRHKEYLESLSEKDRVYRESLSLKDQALYDYFSMSPAKPKSTNEGFTLESALGPELTVGDCTAELWAKIGFSEY